MGISDAYANMLLDGAAPAGFFLALFTTNPNFETGAGGTEATGGSYARIALTMAAAASRARTNSSGPHEFVVGTNLAAAGYTGWGLYSASTAGTFLGGAAFAATRTVSVAGDKISFAAGSIDLELPNS